MISTWDPFLSAALTQLHTCVRVAQIFFKIFKLFFWQKALEALVIVLALVQLLYLLALHAGHFLGPNYGPSHGNTVPTPGTGVGPKTGIYGTSGASDV